MIKKQSKKETFSFSYLLFLLLFINVKPLLAQNDSALFVSPFLKDPIIEMLDSLEKERYFTCNSSLTDSCMAIAAEGRPTSVPYYDDLIIEARLAKLDAETPFDLIFNQSVKNYIQLYGYKGRGLLSRMNSLANLYFPLFEEKLAKYNLPMEFKYLAIQMRFQNRVQQACGNSCILPEKCLD